MIRRIPPIVIAALLLAACDKPRGSGGTDETTASGEASGTKRSARPKREHPSDAEQDPRAALQAAAKLPSQEEREKAIADIVWDALELDPALAREAFSQLTPDSAETIRLIQHSAMRLAESDPAEAMKWADSLGTEKEIAAAKCQIALVLAENEPLRAAGILSESGVEGREFDVAAVQVLQRWAAKSPPDAAEWVAAFPAGAARPAGIKEVVSRWLGSDAEAVFAWKAHLEDSTVRNEVVSALVEISMEQGSGGWLTKADAETRAAIDAKRKEAGHDNPPP